MSGDLPLITQVRAVLTDAEFVRLAEELGGDRVYIPTRLGDRCGLVVAVGRDMAERISKVAGGEWLVVPLAKRERALVYEAQGLNDSQIARKLCMTRSGVQRLLDRVHLAPQDEEAGL